MQINQTLPHICTCLKPGPGFATLYVMVFFVFTDWRLEVIVRFVDVGEILGHHCLAAHMILTLHVLSLT
jgi:hypothetical protein